MSARVAELHRLEELREARAVAIPIVLCRGCGRGLRACACGVERAVDEDDDERATMYLDPASGWVRYAP